MCPYVLPQLTSVGWQRGFGKISSVEVLLKIILILFPFKKRKLTARNRRTAWCNVFEPFLMYAPRTR